MSYRGKTWKGQILALVMVLCFLIGISLIPMQPQDVSAAPNAVVTPIAVGRTEDAPKLAVFFDEDVLTTTTRRCTDSTYWDKMDLHYTIDQGTTNTLTLTLEFSNNRTTYPNGIDAVAGNSTDADDFAQVHLFGVETCVLAQLTNSNPITVSAIGLLK